MKKQLLDSCEVSVRLTLEFCKHCVGFYVTICKVEGVSLRPWQ